MQVKPRFCRVCGQPFRPVRSDALTCSTTCRMRKSRGQDLAYLAALPDRQAEARRFLHEVDLDVVLTARSASAARRQGRNERRSLPRVRAMKAIRAPSVSGAGDSRSRSGSEEE